MFWRREKYILLVGMQTPNHPVRSLITIVITPSGQFTLCISMLKKESEFVFQKEHGMCRLEIILRDKPSATIVTHK
jgi:hypothetical protein